MLNVPSDTKLGTTPSDNAPAVKSKNPRMSAADFMRDDESDGGVKVQNTGPADVPAMKKSKKSKKFTKGGVGETLTADGVNGMIEHAGDEKAEVATAQKPVATSMQAEADRTVEHEVENGFGGVADEDNEDGDAVGADDNAAALLAGFDSDSEDFQEGEEVDLIKMPPLPRSKKTLKKLEKAKANRKDEGPGTVYVGRVPHGFYEKEMRAYFSQFGDISRLRLSRNKRTGASKHFAFIEFAHDSVAKIAAEAMDNYLMFGHILKCKYAEPGSLHPDVWKGADKKFRKIPHEKLERERLAAPKTEEQWQKKVDKEQKKRDKKAKKMRAFGLDMPSSTLTTPSFALEQRWANEDRPKQIDEGEAAPLGVVEAPADVPKDEVAVKEGKQSQKEKKAKKAKKSGVEADTEPEAALDSSAAAIQQEIEAEIAVLVSETEAPILSTTEPTDGKVETNKEKNKISKEERKAMKKAKRAAEKYVEAPEPARVQDGLEEAVQAPKPEAAEDAKAELSADFISLGEFHENEGRPNSTQNPGGGRKLKPWKVKKPKKERKNLVKARGPKSKLVSTKPKPDPNATGKIPGLPLMGKGKYDKATRLAHKELKKKIVAERLARGLPPTRRARSAGAQG